MPKKSGWAGVVLLWVAAVAWIAVLFLFSVQSAEESEALSLGVLEHVMRLFPFLPFEMEQVHVFVRKAAHFCIFGLEGFLLGLAMMKTLPKRWLSGTLAVVSCAVVAVLNEYHQCFSEGRSCELRDMIIDSCGALLGVLVGALLLHVIDRFSRRRRNVIIS